MVRTGKTTTMPYRETSPSGGRAKSNIGFNITGYCPAHHGEFLQGEFETDERLRRGLITVPFGRYHSEARFEIGESSGVVTVTPPDRIKARIAAQLTLRECGQKGRGGLLTLYSNIPMKLGMGSSTADVVASIKAVAKALKVILPAEVIAELAVAAEKASDSTMFGNRAVLLGHREGAVIEYFSGQLPHLLILGFNTDALGAGVDTLAFPPAQYDYKQVMEFGMLRALVRRAIDTQSAALVGRVASASARINQNFLPKPHFDILERIVEEVGALGLQVAHSGTIAGLLFEPRGLAVRERLGLAQVRLAELGMRETWDFEVSDQRREVAA